MSIFSSTIVKIFLFVFLMTNLIPVAYGQTKAEKLDKLISTYARYGKFNGTALVAEKGNVIYKKGFGAANIEWNIPNQPDTKHRLGSITKQFTAMLILQQVEQGKLKLHVPISTYLPDYPKKTGDIITIHHLLTHSSGIPNMTAFPGFLKNVSRNAYTPEQLVQMSADSALQFTPGKSYAYSNSGYLLLGYILEKVTGKTYEQLLQENILTPLQMHHTGYDHPYTIIKNRASGYEKAGRRFFNAPYIDMAVPYAAGAMYSTVEDLYRWDQALYGNQLLRKENMDLMFTRHMQAGNTYYYGYGWNIESIAIGDTRIETIGHGGGINGFNTQITRIPENQSLIVLLDNTVGDPLHEITNAIIAILHDAPYSFPKQSVAYALANRIDQQGLQAALNYYKNIKDSSGYYLQEREMNMTGYQFLEEGKRKEAAAIFRLNIEAFPKSFNTYDSYGEALMALGNKNEGIENYKQSVRLNPGNENGIRILKANGVKTDDLIKKVSLEYLKRLVGEYHNVDNHQWKITFDIVDGTLYGNDNGYRYKVLAVDGEGAFVNPDDGASLIFNTKAENTITMVLFGNLKFIKVR